jgi:RHS repeat-associated protein
VEVNGNTVIGPVTDSAFTSGDAGVWSYAPSNAGSHRFDNFSITPLGGGVYRKVKVLAMTDARRRAVVTAPPANTTYRVYYYGGGKPIAMRVMPPNDATGTVHYLLSDHLGSMSASVDPNLNVTRQYFYPYGGVRSGSGTLPTAKGFTGQYADSSTGLMFFNARYYSSYLNRWLQPDSIVPDPANPQDLNRYSFVRNNPVKYTDPSGHCGVVAGAAGNTVGTLDCSYQDFENMSLQDRMAWIQALMQEPGLTGWFNNIASVMQAYINLGMGGQANWNTSWLGLTNAGILLSIHDGYAMFTTGTSRQGQSGNAGDLWNVFFTANDRSPNNPDLVRMWGTAEAAGTAYGLSQAAAQGRSPGLGEAAFLTIGDWYREGSLPVKAGAIGLGLGAPVGGLAGSAICGPACALAGTLVGGGVGGGAGYGYAKYAEDPRNLIGSVHPVYPFAMLFLAFR